MYLGITLDSMKDVSNTVIHVIMLKETREVGRAMREVSNKYTVGLANRLMFTMSV